MYNYVILKVAIVKKLIFLALLCLCASNMSCQRFGGEFEFMLRTCIQIVHLFVMSPFFGIGNHSVRKMVNIEQLKLQIFERFNKMGPF